MIYVEIEGVKYPAKIDSFHTQMGSPAVRVTGETPTANGFRIYNDDDLVADMSEYTYLYREEGAVKEYTKEAEEIIHAEGYVSELPVNPVQRQLAALNSRINAITPYTDTKKAYYGEIEKVFYNVPTGNLSIFFDNYTGAYTVNRVADRLTVAFPERLKDMTSVTVMVEH